MTYKFKIQNNAALTDLGEALPVLTTVGQHLCIQSNRQLISIGSSFPSLLTVGGQLCWHTNGWSVTTSDSVRTPGTQAFCASARAILCLTTTSYWGSSCSVADDSGD